MRFYIKYMARFPAFLYGKSVSSIKVQSVSLLFCLLSRFAIPVRRVLEQGYEISPLREFFNVSAWP